MTVGAAVAMTGFAMYSHVKIQKSLQHEDLQDTESQQESK